MARCQKSYLPCVGRVAAREMWVLFKKEFDELPDHAQAPYIRAASLAHQSRKTARAVAERDPEGNPHVEAPDFSAATYTSFWGLGNEKWPVAPTTIRDELSDLVEHGGLEAIVKKLEQSRSCESSCHHVIQDDPRLFDVRELGKWRSRVMPCKHVHPGLCSSKDLDVYDWVMMACRLLGTFFVGVSEQAIGETLLLCEQTVGDGPGLAQPWRGAFFLSRLVRKLGFHIFVECTLDGDVAELAVPFHHMTTWGLLRSIRRQFVGGVRVRMVAFEDISAVGVRMGCVRQELCLPVNTYVPAPRASRAADAVDSDDEVAHGDAREVDGVGGVLAGQDVLHDLDAVEVEVLVAEEDVEEEELADRVGEVEDLDEEVEDDEVGAADGARLAGARRHVAARGAGAAAAGGVREAELLDVAVALLGEAALALAARVRVLVNSNKI